MAVIALWAMLLQTEMKSSSKYESVVLATPRLFLCEFHVKDTEAVQAYAGDPEVTRFTSVVPNTFEMTRMAVRVWTSTQLSRPRSDWPLAIVRREDGLLIGGIAVNVIDQELGSAGIGYALRRTAWGQGYATEAAAAVRDWTFSTIGLSELVAHCEPRNNASIRVLQKLGFQPRGLVASPRFLGGTHRCLSFSCEATRSRAYRGFGTTEAKAHISLAADGEWERIATAEHTQS